MPPSLQCPHHPLPSPHTPYTYHPHSLLHCPQYLLVVLLLVLLASSSSSAAASPTVSLCCKYFCIMLWVQGFFCSTCGLLPTFSLAMASPLLVKKNAWLVSVTPSDSHPPPPPPHLNVIKTLTVGKMICESPLMGTIFLVIIARKVLT